MRARTILPAVALTVAALVAPSVLSTSGTEPIGLTLSFETGAFGEYPTCAGWAAGTVAGVAPADAASLRIRAQDAAGAAWHDETLVLEASPHIRADFRIPFVGADGTPWPAGTYRVTASAEDVEGHVGEDVRTLTLFDHEDSEDPWVGAFPSSEHRSGAGWHRAPVLLLASATDDCRVASLDLALDGAPVPLGTVLSAEGLHAVSATAQDIAGNVSVHSVSVGIDLAPPAVTLAHPPRGALVVRDAVVASSGSDLTLVVGRVTLAATAADALSGVATVEWLVDGAVVGEGATLSHAFRPGPHTLAARVADAAGNVAQTPDLSILALG